MDLVDPSVWTSSAVQNPIFIYTQCRLNMRCGDWDEWNSDLFQKKKSKRWMGYIIRFTTQRKNRQPTQRREGAKELNSDRLARSKKGKTPNSKRKSTTIPPDQCSVEPHPIKSHQRSMLGWSMLGSTPSTIGKIKERECNSGIIRPMKSITNNGRRNQSNPKKRERESRVSYQ
jgi:hypothetical protein